MLPEYTRVRVPDDHAIADLAMYNYVEVLLFEFIYSYLNQNFSVTLSYQCDTYAPRLKSRNALESRVEIKKSVGKVELWSVKVKTKQSILKAETLRKTF